MATPAEILEAEKKEQERLKALKGIQSLFVTATVDPTTFTQFQVREDVVEHFEIELVATSVAATDEQFIAKDKTPTATKKVVTVSNSGAGSQKNGSNKLIGRAIKIPTNGGYQRKLKGGLKPVKEVTIRVPSNMSLPAICLWINTAFKATTKKPTYFRTPSGSRVSINSAFADKTKLANKKNE